MFSRHLSLIGLFLFLSILLTGCVSVTSKNHQTDFPDLTGDYFGQTPPDAQPQIFAPGLISTGLSTRDLAMTPTGEEIFFCVEVGGYTYSSILHTKRVDGHWTAPEVAPFSGNPAHHEIEPHVTPDGRKLYYCSDRPDLANGQTEGNSDIWVVDRTSDGWGEPYNLGAPICTEAPEFFPSVTNDGTMYFTRADPETRANSIWRSRLEAGQYQEPEQLGPEVNAGRTRFNAFIAPDESYLILGIFGLADTFGATDYYVCFRSPDDTWTEPINLGDTINTEGGFEFSPYVSPDGLYFFFMSSRGRDADDPLTGTLTFDRLKQIHTSPQNGNAGIYWVDASFIDNLKP